MNHLDAGIGEWVISTDPDVSVKTYALGSCVALLAWDKKVKVAALIHIALPDSSINPEKAQQKPGYFVDSGLPLFFKDFKKQGASRENTILSLVGGASIMDESKTFDIGRRNILGVKKALWNLGLALHKEETGGENSRTVELNNSNGEIELSSKGIKWIL